MYLQTFPLSFLFSFVAGIFSLPALGIAESEPNFEDRPNVIVFLSDDQGYGDFSYTGNRDLEHSKH